MKTKDIHYLVNLQIPNNEDSQAFYQSLLGNINSLSPIKSFVIGINTGHNKFQRQDSNITIITFEDLSKGTIRQQIIDQINYDSDEYLEYKFLDKQDILILSFDF